MTLLRRVGGAVDWVPDSHSTGLGSIPAGVNPDFISGLLCGPVRGKLLY